MIIASFSKIIIVVMLNLSLKRKYLLPLSIFGAKMLRVKLPVISHFQANEVRWGT